MPSPSRGPVCCSRSTATRSPTAPTTRCRSRSSGAGGRPADALVGFANFLLRLWEAEQPAAVVVGWDSLDVPTYRHEALPGYQAGRVFDEALLEQLDALPGARRRRSASSPRKARRLRGRRLPRRRGRALAGAGRRRDLRPRRVPARERPRDGAAAGQGRERARRGSGRPRCASATASTPSRCRTSSRCAATPPTASRARRASGRRRRPTLLAQYGTLEAALADGRFAAVADDLRLYRRIAHDGRRGAAARAARDAAGLGARRGGTRASSG